jgi:hypothetical protein
MICNTSCKICQNLVPTTSATVVTVAGVDTLVYNISSATIGSLSNCRRICLVVTQPVPATTPVGTPVAISVDGVTTTVFPLVQCNGIQVVASQVSTRCRYKTRVVTNGTTGSFVLDTVLCNPTGPILATLPTEAPTETP